MNPAMIGFTNLTGGKLLENNGRYIKSRDPRKRGATPGIVAKYAFNDEQALFAKVRYNRLVDVFTGEGDEDWGTSD